MPSIRPTVVGVARALIGKASAFSFYPGKNLGACGEAGRRDDR